MPTAARTTAMAANIPNSTAYSRGRDTALDSRSSSVSTLKMPALDVRRPDDIPQLGRDRGWIAVRAQSEIPRLVSTPLVSTPDARPLAEIDEHLRFGRFIEAKLPHVVHDADDLPRVAVAPDIRDLSDRVLATEVAARQRLVDDEHPRLTRAIRFGKRPPGDHADAHDLQVTPAHEPGIFSRKREGRGLFRVFWRSPESGGLSVGHHRQLVRVRRRLDSRKGFEPRDDLVGKCPDLRGERSARATPPERSRRLSGRNRDRRATASGSCESGARRRPAGPSPGRPRPRPARLAGESRGRGRRLSPGRPPSFRASNRIGGRVPKRRARGRTEHRSRPRRQP